MNYPFRNLVFEGGGVKGIGHVGALKYLEEVKILQNIKRFGGTSAGAIIALALGLGYNAKELESVVRDTKYRAFKDDNWGFIRDNIRLFFDGYGKYKGDFFTHWIEELIESKKFNKNITFKELFEQTGKEIYFQGTNISTHRIQTFSHKDPTTATMPISKAVRISMSIPYFFKAVEWNGDYYVDGGILDNYPIDLFDWKSFVSQEENFTLTASDEKVNTLLRSITPSNELFFIGENDEIIYNKETLGIRLDSKEEIAITKHIANPKSHHIDHLIVFAWNLTETMLKAQTSMRLAERDSVRTIYVDTEFVSTFDFNITTEMQNKLLENGYKAAEEYCKNYRIIQ